MNRKLAAALEGFMLGLLWCALLYLWAHVIVWLYRLGSGSYEF